MENYHWSYGGHMLMSLLTSILAHRPPFYPLFFVLFVIASFFICKNWLYLTFTMSWAKAKLILFSDAHMAALLSLKNSLSAADIRSIRQSMKENRHQNVHTHHRPPFFSKVKVTWINKINQIKLKTRISLHSWIGMFGTFYLLNYFILNCPIAVSLESCRRLLIYCSWSKTKRSTALFLCN